VPHQGRCATSSTTSSTPPTILEIAGLPHPARVNGVEQDPLHGVSMRYSFDEERATDQHTTQYFEIGGNRGIYHQGWGLSTPHPTDPYALPGVKLGDDQFAMDGEWRDPGRLALVGQGISPGLAQG